MKKNNDIEADKIAFNILHPNGIECVACSNNSFKEVKRGNKSMELVCSKCTRVHTIRKNTFLSGRRLPFPHMVNLIGYCYFKEPLVFYITRRGRILLNPFLEDSKKACIKFYKEYRLHRSLEQDIEASE